MVKKSKKALVPAERERSERALTVVDPLRAYLQQVRHYPMLSADQEQRLVEKYRTSGDVEAARQLVTAHLRLVVKIALHYRNAYYNLLDLIQEGNVGLMQAVKKYDPDKGSRFGYYATWWIKSYILKYILDNFRLIKIGTTRAQRKLFYNLIQEKQKMEAMGFAPEGKILAARLGTTEAEIEEMNRRLTQSERSLTAPLGPNDDGDSATLEDFIADNDVPIDEKLANREIGDIFHAKLKEFAKELKPRELKVFQERLLAEVPRTLQDIADEYGISKERARQIEERIKEKLKVFFEASGLH